MSALNFFDTREKRLFALFAGYFHQDWHDFQPTPKHVIDDYISSHDHEFSRVVVEDLRWLRTQAEESSELWGIIVERYGTEYDGGLVGQNSHRWVDSIADQIERSL